MQILHAYDVCMINVICLGLNAETCLSKAVKSVSWAECSIFPVADENSVIITVGLVHIFK